MENTTEIAFNKVDICNTISVVDSHNIDESKNKEFRFSASSMTDIKTPEIFEEAKTRSTSNSNIFQFKNESTQQWTNGLAVKFDELVKKKALKRLNEDELGYFKDLQKIRRKLHHPRTGQEAIYKYKKDQILKGMIDALEGYVEFIKIKN